MSALVRLNDAHYLQALWPFDSNAKDLSGHKNDGTWAIAEAYADGPNGRKVGRFNATGIVDCGNVTGINVGTGDFTIACWAYIDSFGAFGVILTKNGPAANKVHLRINDGTPAALQININGSWMTSSNFFLNRLGVWTHVVVTRVSGVANSYRDGEWFDDDAEAGNIDNNENLRIGANVGNVEKFPGNLKDIRIYNVGLAGEEVSELFLMTQFGGQ